MLGCSCGDQGQANSNREGELGSRLSLKLTRSQLPARIYLSTATPQRNQHPLYNFFVNLTKTSALPRQQASTMRFAIGATVALAAAVVRADDASSAETETSSSTTVAKPTFTVCLNDSTPYNDKLTSHSPPSSRRISSSNLQTTGKIDGSLRTQRRTSRPTMRNGHTLVPGPLRSLRC